MGYGATEGPKKRCSAANANNYQYRPAIHLQTPSELAITLGDHESLAGVERRQESGILV